MLLESFSQLQFLSKKTHSDDEIIQESGVTIDMTGISSVTVNADKTVASIGAGATWLHVYLYLDGLGVAVAGGRNAAVGVGGLTLGGWSFLVSPYFDYGTDVAPIRWHLLFCTTRRMGMRQRREL